MITIRPVISSKNPCPVCGNKKWHPLACIVSDRPEDWCGDQSIHEPAVDAPKGDFYDECTKCGTVVV